MTIEKKCSYRRRQITGNPFSTRSHPVIASFRNYNNKKCREGESANYLLRDCRPFRRLQLSVYHQDIALILPLRLWGLRHSVDRLNDAGYINRVSQMST
jgi:hypothetical protein